MRFTKSLKIIILAFLLIVAKQSYSQPIPTTTDSRIRTLVYNPNEVYEVRFYYGYQSFVEFSDSEEIEMISIGESFAWRITPIGKRLFIRPLEIAAHTNMTVITNKRTYHFDIKSGEYDGKADEELVYTIRFYYPQLGQHIPIPPQLAMPAIPKSQQRGAGYIKRPILPTKINDPLKTQQVYTLENNPEGFDLNFDYKVAGKSDNILPRKVYDNGKETFMQFQNNNAVIPTISSVDDFGIETQLSYVIINGYVVLPTVEKQFTLRLADSLLCVYNNRALLK